MRLVLDTNILIAALVKNSITCEILIHPDMKYFIPEFAIDEIEKHEMEILQKSCLSKNEFTTLFDYLKENLILVPDEEIEHKEKAKLIMKDIDINDTIFIALALSTKNEGIWSQDCHFEKQTLIKVWKTKDIINYLGIEHQ